MRLPPACSTAAESRSFTSAEVNKVDPSGSPKRSRTRSLHTAASTDPHQMEALLCDSRSQHPGRGSHGARRDGVGESVQGSPRRCCSCSSDRGLLPAIRTCLSCRLRSCCLASATLLYAAAIRTSVIDFRANRRSIAQLSVLLVIVTALGVGLITWLILPVSFPVAFALGAVVAPPDAIAATTIARRIGLPRRLVTILEGESLVNDATAITCLRVAIVAISGTITATQATVGFLIAAFGGFAVGLVVALVVIPIRMRITQPVFDTAISILVPFAATCRRNR